MIYEGTPLDARTVSLMGPYLKSHINRFGDYRIDKKRKPQPLLHKLKLRSEIFEETQVAKKI